MIDRIASLLKIQKPLLNRGFLFASGTTVPSDGDDGYQTGCTYQKTDGGNGTALYVNEGSVTSAAFTAVEGGDIGAFASGGSTDGTVLLSTSNTSAHAIFGGLATDPGSGTMARSVRSRLMVNTGGNVEAETYGLQGQLVVKESNLGHWHGGVLGTIECQTALSVYNPLAGVGALVGRIGGSTITIQSSCYLAGVIALASSVGVSNSGVYAGLYVTKTSGASNFSHGAYIEDSDIGVALVGTMTEGITFGGTYTGNAIDFSNATIDHTGSNGPCLIRAGTYASPVTNADEDQSGMIRLYSSTSANGTSYDRGLFIACKTSGTKNIYPVAGLAEVLAQSGAGPTEVMGAQFIAHLFTSTSKIAAGSWGLFGTWNKIAGESGSSCASGTWAAPVWLDNQMMGTMSGAEYGMFCTTGGTRPDGLIGLRTSSSGYDQFIYADATFDSGAGTCITTDSVPGTQDARIKVWYNGLQYYIPLHR